MCLKFCFPSLWLLLNRLQHSYCYCFSIMSVLLLFSAFLSDSSFPYFQRASQVNLTVLPPLLELHHRSFFGLPNHISSCQLAINRYLPKEPQVECFSNLFPLNFLSHQITIHQVKMVVVWKSKWILPSLSLQLNQSSIGASSLLTRESDSTFLSVQALPQIRPSALFPWTTPSVISLVLTHHFQSVFLTEARVIIINSIIHCIPY